MCHDIEEYFINKGMVNPRRSIHLIKRVVDFLELNLHNLTVFTEAASSEFIYTSIIAAMAGAEKVYAISKDSSYGLKEQIKTDTMLFAKLCGVENKIEVVFDKEKIGEAHIVTNLGFVRPIDKCTVDKMREDAVVPYMCEAWEVRSGDVDIEYCKEKGINVVGTNENYPGLDVFNFSGYLALKMLFDAKIEIYKSKIVIVSEDRFGSVIHNTLSKLSNDVILIKEINEKNSELVKDVDALIIADYTSNKCYIGKDNSQITSQELKKLSKSVTVIQFAGIVDIEDLNENNIFYYPKYEVGSFRMGKTLAYLGPKPIIDLHCAGLKVGELAYRNEYKLSGNKLCQNIL
ncbi:hypothetical protein SAMN02745248_00299 [Hathewaya proteolytica DSM 3090]|uniref:Uncharacterized protein n=1 Tax=Hathewaya proteolytica DSM 3090 TaxID=1121331 RepID=A0A1M6JRQ5_9CLOT|nr:hypothetical protein [Hathewaya proteolytica]SHJ49417.1 hypothetical protein SAMN02745248_00299 [Hathewaya proteolytica DSM 3090]